mmetsp:Transcript_19063/g.44827  ORF Transcript_19063/g.44827 Transcript_19063/m.44827 type:complete len:213 (-) Transcript_19063:166-804(-)
MLSGFSRNVSHQEIERILSEIEAWWEASHDQVGVEWLPVDAITNFLCNDLGYEDLDEFEDAIQGSFQDFLAAFPHIEVKEVEGKLLFSVRKLEPKGPRKLVLTVASAKQLLETTFMKALDAELEIPHLEFSIGADQRRHIDSLYNHIVAAHHELEAHCQNLGDRPEEKASILETISGLNEALEVQEPFDMVVKDPSGLSEFKPEEGVRIEDL